MFNESRVLLGECTIHHHTDSNNCQNLSYAKTMNFFLKFIGTLSGWYIYAESSGGSGDDRAPLTTPLMGQTGPQCILSFWYHMYGTSVGTLSVKFAFLDGSQPVIWTKSGSQGNQWRNGRLVIGSRRLFKVGFQNVRENGDSQCSMHKCAHFQLICIFFII